MPIQIIAAGKGFGICVSTPEIKSTVPAGLVPAAPPGVGYDILAAQIVQRIFQVDFPDSVVIGDGGDFIVRHPLRHPVMPLYHRHDPAFFLIGHQIRAAGIGIAVLAHQGADDVHGLTRRTGLLDGCSADFVHQAALRPVFTRAALVGGQTYAELIGITVPGSLAGEFKPEIGAALRGGRHLVDVEHLLPVLVFVVAQIDVPVGGGVPSGEDAKTKQGKQKGRAHQSTGKVKYVSGNGSLFRVKCHHSEDRGLKP